MNKHFLNEKGITLVELLAALSLFAVVSALVMTVLFNVFRNSENISDNAQLRQDANLLVSTLRSHYNQDDLEEDKFEVSLENGNILLIDGQEVNSSMTSSIAELKINDVNLIPTANESMIVKADGTPLSIDLTLENEAGQTYNLFTTIEKPAELAIALQVIEKPGPPVRSGIYKREVPGCDNIPWNTEYTFPDSNHLIPQGCNKDIITIDGHVWIPKPPNHNQIEMRHNKVRYNVIGNLFVDQEFYIDNEHPMTVQGDALFNGKLELKNLGKFIATNIHAAGWNNNNKSVVVRDHTRLEARQSMVVANIFEMKDHGQAKIGKNLIIDGNLEMYNYAEIIVEGSARIGGDLILSENSNLTIKGNLAIKGEVKQDNNKNNRTIHVEGITNFSKGKPEWLTVSKDVNVED